jgi:hypothetical protein
MVRVNQGGNRGRGAENAPLSFNIDCVAHHSVASAAQQRNLPSSFHLFIISSHPCIPAKPSKENFSTIYQPPFGAVFLHFTAEILPLSGENLPFLTACFSKI